jgi:hypothetical protein
MNKDLAAAKSRDEIKFNALACLLPDDQAGLLRVAEDATRAFDAAIMARDSGAADAAADQIDAVVWKLNGGTFFGCRADDDSPANLVAQHCAAAPGIPPLWGQLGEFLTEAAGVRALVRVSSGFSTTRFHLNFHAIDVDVPFISETGYRSHFVAPVLGCTVAEAAQGYLAGLVKSEGRKMIALDARTRCRELTCALPWLALTAPSQATFESDQGQLCFAF